MPSRADAANPVEAKCLARGFRLTGPRRLIAKILYDAHDHPDVRELHRRVREQDPSVSLATVYRTVRLLESQGIIQRHAFQDGRARYEEASRKHHDHLIDVETGKLVEFTSPEIEKLQDELAARLGYTLIGHRLELYARRRPPKASVRRR
jgi:Fur family ferric uptake transcriptional regulator